MLCSDAESLRSIYSNTPVHVWQVKWHTSLVHYIYTLVHPEANSYEKGIHY